MRTLITGASGFVGKHLVRHLLESGDEVCASYYPGSTEVPHIGPSGSLDQQCLEARLTWRVLDVSDGVACAQVFSDAQPEIVYHLAGMSFIPEAEQDFLGALRANVAGFDNVARVCHQLQKDIHIILVSSADVYGQVHPDDLPVREATTPQPVTSYSTTKLMAELVAERWNRLGKVKVTVMRPFNHIGPGQDFRFVAASFAYQLSQIAAGKQAPKLQVGNLSALRDFTDVRDVVRAYRLAGLLRISKDSSKTERFVICSGKSVAVEQILRGLITVSGLQVEVTHDPARMRPTDVPELYGSYEKAEQELGWKPLISLEQSLKDIYEEVVARTC